MVVGIHRRAVGVFSHRRDAEAAINDLRAAGFPLSQISLIHRDWSRRDRFAGVTYAIALTMPFTIYR
ncbi:general stress protein [Fischerella thermalis]|jgi:hypothetical protein|uniref:general stress protein n=1 Tax=Fischerella thermalis TaxID=372787 RepID=UPI00215532C2|nr:general stress protein [Fischerella thermalis]